MNIVYKVAALIIFVIIAIRNAKGYPVDCTYDVVGWLMIVCGEICELKKEIVRNERINKSYYNRDRRSDKQSSEEY